MGFFSKPKPQVQYVSQDTSASDAEKKETRTAKGRLLETEGGNKGAELQAGQGRSVRRVFGG